MKLFLKIILLITLPAASFAQDTIFIKSYGETGYNYGEKVIQTADTGYIILGNKTGFVGNSDVYLLKTNYCGNIKWDKAYGGPEVDWAEDIVRTNDKGYAITGYMTIPAANNNYDVMLIKTDSLGVMQWMKHYGGSDWDLGHSLVETQDSGFIIAGETFSYGHGNNDVFLIKTNKNGDSLWSKCYGGVKEEVANDISACHDGNYIISGKTNSFGIGGYDIYLLKVNPNGDTLWTRTYGDTLDDFGYSAIETFDHGLVIIGSTRNYSAVGLDGLMIKTDSIGNQLWYRTFGYGGTADEEYFDIAQNKNNGFLITGYTSSFGAGRKDFSMILTDAGGWYQNGTTYGGGQDDYSRACIYTSDNGYAIVGTTESMGLGAANILFLKTDSMGVSNISTYTHVTGIPETTAGAYSCFPNPVTDMLIIKSPENNILRGISLYNHLGQIVYKTDHPGKNNATIDFQNYPAGLYVLVMQMNGSIRSEKILHITK